MYKTEDGKRVKEVCPICGKDIMIEPKMFKPLWVIFYCKDVFGCGWEYEMKKPYGPPECVPFNPSRKYVLEDGQEVNLTNEFYRFNKSNK